MTYLISIASFIPVFIFRSLFEQLLLFFSPEVILLYGCVLILNFWMPFAVYQSWGSKLNFTRMNYLVLRGLFSAPLFYFVVSKSGYFFWGSIILLSIIGMIKKFRIEGEIFSIAQISFFWGLFIGSMFVAKNNGHLNLDGLNPGALFDSYVFKDLVWYSFSVLGSFGLITFIRRNK